MKAADVARSVHFGAMATLRKQGREWNDLVVAALVQGRAMFAPGTAERAFIDCVPKNARQQSPVEAEFTAVESPVPGVVHLEFAAEHATSFTVWHKGPDEPAFVLVAEVPLPGVYDALGLMPGEHEYEVQGRNSRGEGPMSEPVVVEVSAAEQMRLPG